MPLLNNFQQKAVYNLLRFLNTAYLLGRITDFQSWLIWHTSAFKDKVINHTMPFHTGSYLLCLG